MPRDAKLFPKLALPVDEDAAFTQCLDMTLNSLSWEDRATLICLLTREARLARNSDMTDLLRQRLEAILNDIFSDFMPRMEALISGSDEAWNFVYSPSTTLEEENWLRIYVTGWLDRYIVPASHLSPALAYCPVRRKGCEPGVPCEPRCANYNIEGHQYPISVRPEWVDF
jgi:hypothetical protein